MGKRTERPLHGGGAPHQRRAFLCCLQHGWYFSRHTFWEHLCGLRAGSEVGRSPEWRAWAACFDSPPTFIFTVWVSCFQHQGCDSIPAPWHTVIFFIFFSCFAMAMNPAGPESLWANQMVCPWGCRVPAPGGSLFCHMHRRKKVSCVIQILKVFLLLISKPKSSISWIV